MRNKAFAVLMFVASGAIAQDPRYAFTVDPDPPRANFAFELNVSLQALSCYTLPEELTISQPSADVVQYELRMEDACLPLPDQHHRYTVPALPSGNYTLRLAACIAPTPQLPTAPCGTVAEHSVVVSSFARPVPILSRSALLLAAGLVGAFGIFCLRRSW
jgi:hypothetical protein